MKVREEWIGSKKTATLGNLADLQEDMALEFDQMHQNMERMVRVQESMLKTLDSIEGRLKDMANHETRIQRLEKEVLFAKH